MIFFLVDVKLNTQMEFGWLRLLKFRQKVLEESWIQDKKSK